MWQTNLKVLLVVVGTLGVYTLVANSIPQVQSEVPEELSFTGEFSAEQLVSAGEELYNGAGQCVSCHGLGTRAPNLVTDHAGEGTVGQRCGDRVAGENCKAYLMQSMLQPNVFVVEGFQPIMPDMSRTLSETQIWAVVAYLQSVGGEVTVNAEDIESSYGNAEGAPAGGSATAAAGGPVGAPGGLDPVALLDNNLCMNCHMMDGRGVQLGPSFDGIGSRLGSDEIRTAILNPNAGASAGFEAFLGVMPAAFGQQFSAEQLEALVQFLAARQ
jgi:mono/diheme cytochrome c family protein